MTLQIIIKMKFTSYLFLFILGATQTSDTKNWLTKVATKRNVLSLATLCSAYCIIRYLSKKPPRGPSNKKFLPSQDSTKKNSYYQSKFNDSDYGEEVLEEVLKIIKSSPKDSIEKDACCQNTIDQFKKNDDKPISYARFDMLSNPYPVVEFVDSPSYDFSSVRNFSDVNKYDAIESLELGTQLDKIEIENAIKTKRREKMAFIKHEDITRIKGLDINYIKNNHQTWKECFIVFPKTVKELREFCKNNLLFKDSFKASLIYHLNDFKSSKLETEETLFFEKDAYTIKNFNENEYE